MAPTPPDCRRLQALIERDLDGELTPEQADFVRDHLAACGSCRDRRDFQRRMRAALEGALRAEPLPAELGARLMGRLDELERAGE